MKGTALLRNTVLLMWCKGTSLQSHQYVWACSMPLLTVCGGVNRLLLVKTAFGCTPRLVCALHSTWWSNAHVVSLCIQV